MKGVKGSLCKASSRKKRALSKRNKGRVKVENNNALQKKEAAKKVPSFFVFKEIGTKSKGERKKTLFKKKRKKKRAPSKKKKGKKRARKKAPFLFLRAQKKEKKRRATPFFWR